MAEGGKNIKKIEKQRNGKHGRNEIEISIIETRYGLRVLVRQGSNKVWLSEGHLATLFNALLARVFGGNKGRRTVKIVYVVHAIRGKVLVDEVLLPYKALDEPLSIEDLENVFEAHNLQSKRLSMTGWPDFIGIKDYVVDVDCMDIWSCEPVEWKKILQRLC